MGMLTELFFNLEPPDMQPEKFSGKLPNINEERSCLWGSDGRNFTLKEIAEIFYDIQSTNAEIMETNPNLKESDDFSNISYWTKKKASTV